MEKFNVFEMHEIPLAPRFSGGIDRPSLATIYFSHYRRLMAVVAAARSGDEILIRLALANLDEHGNGDEIK